jgi:hypothetical protein
VRVSVYEALRGIAWVTGLLLELCCRTADRAGQNLTLRFFAANVVGTSHPNSGRTLPGERVVDRRRVAALAMGLRLPFAGDIDTEFAPLALRVNYLPFSETLLTIINTIQVERSAMAGLGHPAASDELPSFITANGSAHGRHEPISSAGGCDVRHPVPTAAHSARASGLNQPRVLALSV